MEIFESDDECFEQSPGALSGAGYVGERNDDPFQWIIFITSTFYTGFVIFGYSVTIGADFRMRQ